MYVQFLRLLELQTVGSSIRQSPFSDSDSAVVWAVVVIAGAVVLVPGLVIY